MAILGGSPLGLIGVRSTPSRDGMSTFNAGKSRNVNINKYNTGKPNEGSAKGGMVSLFTGGNRVKAWPNIKVTGTDNDAMGLNDNYKGAVKSTLHNNDVYDTSVLNIIEKLASTSAALRPSDFAYLKDLGVYPNNRLMIARRFGGAIGDDILRKGRPPQSVMISWKPEEEDFFEISFGEEWEDADADFTGILNDMGEDFLGKNVGGAIGGGLGAIPLPGFAEGLQRAVLESLGVFAPLPTNKNGVEILPAGNPNIIKMAKKRKTFGYSEKGSGLKCTFQVSMICEYEQKFISGIDPTIVWQDLLGNILRFGTSPSSTYGLSKEFGNRVKGWASNPRSMVTEFANALEDALNGGLMQKLRDLIEASGNDEDEDEKDQDEITEELLDGFDTLKKEIIESLESTVLKYEHSIRGVVNALSGAPSTPWHITLGNPLRPVFCAGDMLVEDVKLVPGPDLAFNDLPARVKVEFTMKNARPWGLQQIAAKFNTGNIRVVNTIRDHTTLKPSQDLYGSPLEFPIEDVDNISGDISTQGNGLSGVSNTSAGENNTNTGVTTENAEVVAINPEAGSGAETNPVITEGETVPTQQQINQANAFRNDNTDFLG